MWRYASLSCVCNELRIGHQEFAGKRVTETLLYCAGYRAAPYALPEQLSLHDEMAHLVR
jgi:hypothetical protein